MSASKEARWAAVYGASIARQVFDHMARGNNGPDEKDMERFAEEAESVANMAEEGWQAFKKNDT